MNMRILILARLIYTFDRESVLILDYWVIRVTSVSVGERIPIVRKQERLFLHRHGHVAISIERIIPVGLSW